MFCLHGRRWPRSLLRFCIGIGSVAALGVAADTAADLVLNKVRAGIATDVSDLRGVACMQTVNRTRYAPRKTGENVSCGDLVATAANTPRGALTWRSRLRLDVMSGATSEQFSLVEASRFEQTDIGGLLSAAIAGNGEFAAFLRKLSAEGAGSLQPLGLQQTGIGSLLGFGFTLPPTYRGSLFAVPDSGALRRLTLQADNVGQACRVQYIIDYAATRIGETGILAPQSSTMEVISKDGTESRTETYYSSCRRTAAKPAPTADAPPLKPLPSGTRFKVRLQPSIDTATAATGDPVVAVIRTSVKDKQGGFFVHAGDRLHGRIALIEQNLSGRPSWNIAIAFETIERGVGERGIDQGVEQLVTLVQVDDVAAPEIQKLRPPNGAYFTLTGANAVLDQKYETEWEIR